MLSSDELNRLYRYSLSLTRNADQAYDVLQASIEKALRRNDWNDVQDKIRYFRGIIRHQFIDEYRHQSVLQFETLDAADLMDINTCTLEQVVLDECELEQVWETLKKEERELLYLWAVEGYTAQEIADEWNQPRGSVLSRIHRVRQRVLKVLYASSVQSEIVK